MFAALALAGCDLQRFIMREAVASQGDYFQTHPSTRTALTRLTEKVWTYNDGFDRALIVDTDEGLVVVDSFSAHLVHGLKAALARAGLSKPVHTLIYTHFHLDHVGGGAELSPANVIAHEKCPGYWKDFDAREILAPTRLIGGDAELTVGRVTFRLVYLGPSHTDTMYAVFVPSEGVLYSADTVGVHVFLPVGGVALYTPGYFRALDRMAQLDFSIFVGSHFGWGTKQDFLEAAQLQRDIRGTVRAAIKEHSGEIAAHVDGHRAVAIFDDFYDTLKAKYGNWYGFDSQVLASFINAYVGEFVGN